jgi:hypothetical protein
MGKTINQLSTASSLSSGDQIVVYSSGNGDARKSSLSALLDWFESAFVNPTFEVQTTAPTSTGFTFTITASTSTNIWAKINGTGNFATGTINLPAAASSADGQEILITTLLNINTITFASSGASIFGAPTGLGTLGLVRFRYETANLRWTMIDVAREQPLRSSIGVTVAELPSAIANKGARSFVTDATSTTFNADPVGGGANIVPVFSSGTGWKIG